MGLFPLQLWHRSAGFPACSIPGRAIIPQPKAAPRQGLRPPAPQVWVWEGTGPKGDLAVGNWGEKLREKEQLSCVLPCQWLSSIQLHSHLCGSNSSHVHICLAGTHRGPPAVTGTEEPNSATPSPGLQLQLQGSPSPPKGFLLPYTLSSHCREPHKAARTPNNPFNTGLTPSHTPTLTLSLPKSKCRTHKGQDQVQSAAGGWRGLFSIPYHGANTPQLMFT